MICEWSWLARAKWLFGNRLLPFVARKQVKRSALAGWMKVRMKKSKPRRNECNVQKESSLVHECDNERSSLRRRRWTLHRTSGGPPARAKVKDFGQYNNTPLSQLRVQLRQEDVSSLSHSNSPFFDSPTDERRVSCMSLLSAGEIVFSFSFPDDFLLFAPCSPFDLPPHCILFIHSCRGLRNGSHQKLLGRGTSEMRNRRKWVKGPQKMSTNNTSCTKFAVGGSHWLPKTHSLICLGGTHTYTFAKLTHTHIHLARSLAWQLRDKVNCKVNLPNLSRVVSIDTEGKIPLHHEGSETHFYSFRVSCFRVHNLLLLLLMWYFHQLWLLPRRRTKS